jgi:hypothetical protein
MGAMPNQQPPNSSQQTSMKSQITSYNQSYNELNTSYETEIMNYEELVHSGVSLSGLPIWLDYGILKLSTPIPNI